MNRLKRFVYSPRVLRALRALRLTEALRTAHYRLATQRGGVYRTNLCGVEAAFRADSPRDLVQVEFNFALEQETLEIVARYLRNGDVFMDVGANIGVFAVMPALIVGERGTVIAFEPDSRSFARLQENLGLNGPRSALTFRVALGEEDGTRHLYLDRPAPSLMVPRQDAQEGGDCEPVDIANGDKFREAHSLPAPRVVKIDAEGYEYMVLRGLRNTLSEPAAELVLCEVHPYLLREGTSAELIAEFLKSLGFDEVTMLPRRREIHVIARKSHAAVQPS